MRKQFVKFGMFLAITIFILFGSIPAMAGNDVRVFVDNNQIIFDVQPQLIGGRTMVPLRAIFESLGAKVLWEEETQTVVAYNDDVLVKATIGDVVMTVNNRPKEMDIAPMKVSDRTLVPARFVAEALNCDVIWDAKEWAVYITSKPVNQERKEIYYPQTDIPTYTSVTGVPEKKQAFVDNSNTKVHVYEDTGPDTVALYWETLVKEYGWSVYDNAYGDNSFTIYFNKGADLISVSSEYDYNEVWIVFF